MNADCLLMLTPGNANGRFEPVGPVEAAYARVKKLLIELGDATEPYW
jgi:hypothetical protein